MDELRHVDALLRDIYFNVKNPACYSGAPAVYTEAKKVDPTITLAIVKEWLHSQETYALQKPAVRKFSRRKTVTSGVGEQYQVDLCDMSALASENQGFRYLLTCIDIFSKRAWALPIKRKTAEECAVAFAKVLVDGVPRKVQADDGKEFKGAFKRLLDQHGIHFFIATNTDIKCAVVERFNRTLKTRMWKYFTEKKTFRYTNVLQDLVRAYNKSWHRSIKCRPVDVTKRNEREVYTTLYGDNRHSRAGFKFAVGDQVRLAKGKSSFDKGYYEKWTREVFVVDRRKMSDEPVYYVRDLRGEQVYGVFYGKELQLVR